MHGPDPGEPRDLETRENCDLAATFNTFFGPHSDLSVVGWRPGPGDPSPVLTPVHPVSDAGASQGSEVIPAGLLVACFWGAFVVGLLRQWAW